MSSDQLNNDTEGECLADPGYCWHDGVGEGDEEYGVDKLTGGRGSDVTYPQVSAVCLFSDEVERDYVPVLTD